MSTQPQAQGLRHRALSEGCNRVEGGPRRKGTLQNPLPHRGALSCNPTVTYGLPTYSMVPSAQGRGRSQLASSQFQPCQNIAPPFFPKLHLGLAEQATHTHAAAPMSPPITREGMHLPLPQLPGQPSWGSSQVGSSPSWPEDQGCET